jgi:hypothetical protein
MLMADQIDTAVSVRTLVVELLGCPAVCVVCSAFRHSCMSWVL